MTVVQQHHYCWRFTQCEYQFPLLTEYNSHCEESKWTIQTGYLTTGDIHKCIFTLMIHINVNNDKLNNWLKQ